MKSSFYFLLFLSLSYFLRGNEWSQNAVTSDKVALIVALSTYPLESGWNKINGENDVSIMVSALKSRGFKAENISVLKGPQATKANIKAELKHLEQKLAKGGFFVFHFSGHGQQVSDREPDLDENDQYDEALVLYDGPRSMPKGEYQGEGHLIDDEMEGLFLPIRKKLGKKGQLLFLLDACHSGTATRGPDDILEEPIRGTDRAFIFPESKETAEDQKEEKENTGFYENNNSNDISDYILISATRPDETNAECAIDSMYYGPLSYAFSVVFPALEETASYQLLFEHISEEMYALTHYQSPTIEGPIGLVVGQDKLNPVHRFFSVSNISRPPGRTLELNAGKIFNVQDSTEIVFYPSVQDTSGQLIAWGKVIKSKEVSAIVQFQLKSGKSRKDIQRAYVSKQGFGNLDVRVAIDFQEPQLERQLLECISEIKAIAVVTEKADLILRQANRTVKALADDRIIAEFNTLAIPDSELMQKIVDSVILPYGQSRFLAALNLKSNSCRLTGRLILVTAELDQNERIKKSTPIPESMWTYNQQGLLMVPENTYYQLEITNTGEKDAYLSALEISPNGQFSTIIPFPYKVDGQLLSPEHYEIKKGDRVILEKHHWQMGRPLGIEQYSIIATEIPIDLRKIVRTKGSFSSESGNEFEELVQESWVGRGTNNSLKKVAVSPIIPDQVNIEKFFVEIVE